MHSLQLHISKVLFPFKIKRMLPQSWEEMHEKVFISLSDPLFKGFKVSVFCIIARIQPYFWALIPSDVKLKLLDLIKFTDEYPHFFLTKQIGNRFAPDPCLDNLSIGQFATADFYFLTFIYKDRSIAMLDKLIATLFNHKDTIYSSKQSEDTVFLKGISPEHKMSIFLCYKGARDMVIQRYPYVFQLSEQNEEPEMVPVAPSEPDPQHLIPLINELSKTGQYGKYSETFDTNMNIIFLNRNEDLKYKK